MECYDLLVIGGGAAGIIALKQCVKLRAAVALVDPSPLEGRFSDIWNGERYP